MFRLTRPLFQVTKRTTGIYGLNVHPDPLPELVKTYESTLSALSAIPQTSVYRQGVEALVRNKLHIVKTANGDVATVEAKLNEGQIEEALDIASDELKLAAKMVEWKAYADVRCGPMDYYLTDVSAAGSPWRTSPSLDNGNIPDRQHQHDRAL